MKDSVITVVVILTLLALGEGVSRLFKSGKPRFIIDERGERQRVDHWNHDQPVYTPKTWQQRVHEEAVLRSKRHFDIFIGALLTLGPGYVAYEAFTKENMLLGALTGPLMITFALPGLISWLVPGLFKELLYQSEYQGMDGAKVLDKAPKPPPGKEMVETQKAHGNAQLAGEADAVAMLKTKR